MSQSKKYDIIIFTDMRGYIIQQKAAGAYNIASHLRQNNYSVKVIDNFVWLLRNHKEKLFSYMENHIGSNTLFVGFSTTFMPLFNTLGKTHQRIAMKGLSNYNISKENSVPNLKEFMNFLGSKFPHVKTILGGQEKSTHLFFKEYDIDCWIKGLAEDSIIKFIDNIKQGKEIVPIMDDPFAVNYNFHDRGPIFDASDTIFQNEVLPIEMSRGCRFKCKFCSYPLLGRKPSDEYIRSEESIYKELLHNYEHFGTTQYHITCDTFNETTDKLERVKRAIDRLGVKINFWAYLRLELLHAFPEQLELLKEMGIVQATFGIETLNDKSAKIIGKGFGRENVLKQLRKIKECWGENVRLHSGFIIGLPYDTKETVEEWMSIIINRETALDTINLNPLYIVPDRLLGKTSRVYFSEFDLNYDKYGYIKTKDGWINDDWTYNEASEYASKAWKQFEQNGDFLDNKYRSAPHAVALMNTRVINPQITWPDIVVPKPNMKESNLWLKEIKTIKDGIYKKYAENVFAS